MTVLRFGLTPKMKPVSPRRSAIVAGLDIGTSKIVCMIARLEPQAPQDVLRRSSHGVHILGFAHTAASGMKAGTVVDLVEVEEMARQAIDIAENMAGVQLESAVVSLSGGRPGMHRIQGIGAGFVPEVLDTAVLDEIVRVPSDQAFAVSRDLEIGRASCRERV